MRKVRGDLTLRGEKLRENHHPTLSVRQARKHCQLLPENPRVQDALAPALCEGCVRKRRQGPAPRGRAAAHCLKQDASAQTGLGCRKLGQSRSQRALPVRAEIRFFAARLEEDGFGSAWREGDSCVRPGVADHHLIEQTAQFLGRLGLSGALLVDKSFAEFLRRWETSRIQERHEMVEIFERILHWGGGQQQEKLAGKPVDSLPRF